LNITFLIGNGFDVGIGMKSKFKDFFPIYQKTSENKPYRIKQLSDEIGKDYDNNYRTWADFERKLGEYTLEFDEKTKQNFIDQIKDFESEFIDYLKWQEAILSFKSTERISAIMVKGLTQYYSSENLAPESAEAVKQVYSGHTSENHTYNFVNFNYTDILKSCLDTIPSKIIRHRKYGSIDKTDNVGKIVHVHGKNDLYPIIGVNDVGQIANKELAKDVRFTQTIVKPNINQLLRCGNDTNATNLIKQSNIICIYGMALGETDKKWWDLLLQWLNGVSSRQLILFEYDDQFNANTPFDWLSKENCIIDKLSQYNQNTTLQVEKLRPRIHIAVHKNIFQINLPYKKDDEYGTMLEKIAIEQKTNKYKELYSKVLSRSCYQDELVALVTNN